MKIRDEETGMDLKKQDHVFQVFQDQILCVRKGRSDKSWKMNLFYNSIQEFSKVSFKFRFLKLKEISENI